MNVFEKLWTFWKFTKNINILEYLYFLKSILIECRFRSCYAGPMTWPNAYRWGPLWIRKNFGALRASIPGELSSCNVFDILEHNFFDILEHNLISWTFFNFLNVLFKIVNIFWKSMKIFHIHDFLKFTNIF